MYDPKLTKPPQDFSKGIPKAPVTPKPADDQEIDLDTWDDMVADKFKVPKSLMKAVRGQESGGDINAKSPTGVRGRYQVTKATAQSYGLDRDDPWQQSVAAAKHLRKLFDETDGADDDEKWLGAVGKYYGGNNAVRNGEIVGSSIDGVSNPAEHVRRVAQKWGEIRRSERGTQPQVQPQQPAPRGVSSADIIPPEQRLTIPEGQSLNISTGQIGKRAPVQGAAARRPNEAVEGAQRALSPLIPDEIEQEARQIANRATISDETRGYRRTPPPMVPSASALNQHMPFKQRPRNDVRDVPMTANEQRANQAGQLIRQIEAKRNQATALFQQADRAPVVRGDGRALNAQDELRAQAEGALEAANRLGERVAQEFGDLVEVGFGADANRGSNRRWVYAKPKEGLTSFYTSRNAGQRAATSSREDIAREVAQQQQMRQRRNPARNSGVLGSAAYFFPEVVGEGLTGLTNTAMKGVANLGAGAVRLGERVAEKTMTGMPIASLGPLPVVLDLVPDSMLGPYGDYRKAVRDGVQAFGQSRQATKGAQIIGRAADTLAPISNEPTTYDPRKAEFYSRTLPQAAGSLVPLVGASLATGGAAAAPFLAGAAMNAEQTYQETMARTGNEQLARQAADTGAAIGALEGFGLGRMLNKFGIKQALAKRALQVVEEAGQEGASQWLNNVNMRLRQIDPNRSLSPLDEEVLGNALLGAIMGGAAQVGGRMISGPEAAQGKILRKGGQPVSRDAAAQEPFTPTVRQPSPQETVDADIRNIVRNYVAEMSALEKQPRTPERDAQMAQMREDYRALRNYIRDPQSLSDEQLQAILGRQQVAPEVAAEPMAQEAVAPTAEVAPVEPVAPRPSSYVDVARTAQAEAADAERAGNWEAAVTRYAEQHEALKQYQRELRKTGTPEQKAEIARQISAADLSRRRAGREVLRQERIANAPTKGLPRERASTPKAAEVAPTGGLLSSTVNPEGGVPKLPTQEVDFTRLAAEQSAQKPPKPAKRLLSRIAELGGIDERYAGELQDAADARRIGVIRKRAQMSPDIMARQLASEGYDVDPEDLNTLWEAARRDIVQGERPVNTAELTRRGEGTAELEQRLTASSPVAETATDPIAAAADRLARLRAAAQQAPASSVEAPATVAPVQTPEPMAGVESPLDRLKRIAQEANRRFAEPAQETAAELPRQVETPTPATPAKPQSQKQAPAGEPKLSNRVVRKSLQEEMGATSTNRSDQLRLSGPSTNYREVVTTWDDAPEGVVFKKPEHYGDQANVLFDRRLEDRTTDKGENAAFLMEMQSDWHQSKDAPAAPLKNTWTRRAIEDSLSEAQSAGQDGVLLPKTVDQIYEIQRWGRVREENGRYLNHEGFDITPVVRRYAREVPELAKKIARKNGVELQTRTVDDGRGGKQELWYLPVKEKQSPKFTPDTADLRQVREFGRESVEPVFTQEPPTAPLARGRQRATHPLVRLPLKMGEVGIKESDVDSILTLVNKYDELKDIAPNVQSVGNALAIAAQQNAIIRRLDGFAQQYPDIKNEIEYALFGEWDSEPQTVERETFQPDAADLREVREFGKREPRTEQFTEEPPTAPLARGRQRITPFRPPSPQQPAGAFPARPSPSPMSRPITPEGRRVQGEIEAGRGKEGEFGKLAQLLFKSTRGDIAHGQDSFFHDKDVKGAVGLTVDAEQGDTRKAIKASVAKMLGVKADEISLTQIKPETWQRWARVKRLGPEANAKLNIAIEKWKQGATNDQETATPQTTERQQPGRASELFATPRETTRQQAPATQESAAIKSGDRVQWEQRGRTETAFVSRIKGDTAYVDYGTGDEVAVPVKRLRKAESPSILQQKMPGFYSQLARVIDQKMPAKASAAQVRAIIENPQSGVKPDEIKWTGLDDFLRDKETVTKADVQEFLKANQVEIREVESGKKAYSNYTLPGAKEGSYRELLLTLPSKDTLPDSMTERAHALAERDGESWSDLGPNARQQYYTRAADQLLNDAGNYRSSHFDEPNILAHIRFNERTDADGKRVLHIEEIQSDWHQDGRKKGYDTPDDRKRQIELEKRVAEIDAQRRAIQPELRALIRKKEDGTITESEKSLLRLMRRQDAELLSATPSRMEIDNAVRGIPDAPFKKNWHELAFKRALRWAAENGYERMTWTTGEQQAERFDLSKQVDEITYGRVGDKYWVGVSKDGREITRKHGMTLNDVEDFIGKEMAQKIERGEGESTKGGDRIRTLTGDNLKIGGEGMKGFYDQILPAFANKYAKKWGAKVGEAKVEVEGKSVNSEIPDAVNALIEQRRGKKYRIKTDPELRQQMNLMAAKLRADSEALPAFQSLPDDQKAKIRQTYTDTPEYVYFSDRGEAKKFSDEAGGAIENLADLRLEKTNTATVHSIDITPAMRESVMQGQVLFQRGDLDTPFKAKPYEQTIRDAKVAFKTGKRGAAGTVWANEDGLVIIRAAIETAFPADEGEVQLDLQNFFNSNTDSANAQKIADVIKAEAADVDNSPDERRAYRQIARELQAAINSGDTVSIVYSGTFPHAPFNRARARRHELFHAAQQDLRNSPSFFNRNPLARKAGDALAAMNYPRSDWTIEAAAYVASGDHSRMGLTEDEGKRFLTDYFDDIVANNGRDALERFVLMAPKMAATLKEAKGKYGIQDQRQAQTDTAQAGASLSGAGNGATFRASKSSGEIPRATPERRRPQTGLLRGIDLEKVKQRQAGGGGAMPPRPPRPPREGGEPRKEPSQREMKPDAEAPTGSLRARAFETLGSYQTAAQLGTPGFVGRNVLQHLGYAIQSGIADRVAQAIDASIAALTRGPRRVVVPGNPVSNAIEGWRAYREGVRDAWAKTRRGEALDSGQIDELKNAPTNKLARAFRTFLTVINEIPDAGNYAARYQRRMKILTATAKRNGMQITEENLVKLQKQAELEAAHDSMRDANFVSEMLKRTKGAMNKLSEPVTGTERFGLGDFILKYTQVPGALIKRGIEYSPLGLIESAFHAGRATMGKGGEYEAKQAIQSLSRAVSGTASTVGMGALLAAAGVLVEPEKEDYTSEELERERGVRGFSVNLSALARLGSSLLGSGEGKTAKQAGDKLVPIDWAQPWAMGASVGATLWNQKKAGKLDKTGAVGAAGKSFENMLEIMGDQSVLKNLRAYVRAMKGDTFGEQMEGAIKKFVKDIPSSFTPGVTRQVGQVIDPNVRDYRTENREGIRNAFAEGMKRAAAGAVPGLSRQFPARVSPMTGEARKTAQGEMGVAGRLLNLLSPVTVNEYKDDPLADAIIRLNEKLDKDKLSLYVRPLSERETKLEGYKEGTTQLRQREGEFARAFARDGRRLVTSSGFKAANESRQAEMLEDLISKLRQKTYKEGPIARTLAEAQRAQRLQKAQRPQ